MLFSGHGMGYGMDAARLSLLLCTLAAVPGGDLVNAASHQRRWVPEQTEQDFFFWWVCMYELMFCCARPPRASCKAVGSTICLWNHALRSLCVPC